MSRQSDMTPTRFDALKAENARIAVALGLESEKLTVALEALHKLLALPPPDDTAVPFYSAMRDIAREGILGKQ